MKTTKTRPGVTHYFNDDGIEVCRTVWGLGNTYIRDRFNLQGLNSVFIFAMTNGPLEFMASKKEAKKKAKAMCQLSEKVLNF